MVLIKIPHPSRYKKKVSVSHVSYKLEQFKMSSESDPTAEIGDGSLNHGAIMRLEVATGEVSQLLQKTSLKGHLE